MRVLLRTVATVQLALMFPAVLFLTSVFVAIGDPPQYDLARFARVVVRWYSGRAPMLWVLLVMLPFAALAAGCAALAYSWNGQPDAPPPNRAALSGIPAPVATLIVAGATMASAGVLAVVVLHIAAN